MNDDEIVSKLLELSPKEILGYAIASEEDAKNYYMELASKSGQLLGEFFETLAKAEEGHKKILLKLHAKLFGDENYQVPEGIPLAETSVKVETVQNLVEAMKVALQNEKNAERIYTHLSKVLPEHGELFSFLATQEKAHYASIKSHTEYLEGLMESKPNYVNAPVTYLNNQLELYLGPRTMP